MAGRFNCSPPSLQIPEGRALSPAGPHPCLRAGMCRHSNELDFVSGVGVGGGEGRQFLPHTLFIVCRMK